MEPKSHEHMPSPIETTPGLSPDRELGAVKSHEQLSPVIEYGQERAPQEQATAAPAAQLPAPIIAQSVAQTTTAASVAADDTPQVAADEDLIEKEWVDKAKKIIAETKDDPHAREMQVGKLQTDYLKKRYGKELGNQE